MAHGRMHGAALAAALAVITCLRARDCPRALAVSAGPSWREPELAGLTGPAARGRGPAPARLVWAGRGHENDSRPRQLAIHCRPLAEEILARHAPSAGRRGWSCACSGSENAGRRQVTDGGAESPVVTLRGGSPTKRAIVSERGIARAASAGGRARRGALPADTTRKGEFAMRDTWT